ncbi:hypothetical protein CPF_2990 [Clostridium perfringens ATCC 13124]|uniref:Uncharacterized protein n=2 Tax=Clostridium perfringens TaxID=1502 RepID=A0A0H2YSW4_CLOP1|nr:hypothetical protein CPF_2990 [Clostridium perfringens ATCC 13124]EDT22614.1 hypothetical protein AC1_3237 [Clostridium perfringens B str. ATCC 3626]
MDKSCVKLKKGAVLPLLKSYPHVDNFSFLVKNKIIKINYLYS